MKLFFTLSILFFLFCELLCIIQNFRNKLIGKSESHGTAYRDESSARSETITETRGILSIYVIIDTSLLIYGVTRRYGPTCRGRKNLEEKEEERKKEEMREKETRRKGRASPLRQEGERQYIGTLVYKMLLVYEK